MKLTQLLFAIGKYDLTIFGATGFTGSYIVEELAKTIPRDSKLSWTVAGRNKSKLETLLRQTSARVNLDLTNIPVVEADVSDGKSLNEMCRRSKLVVNCVGPYRFFGESVVKACVENGTHYMDVCGEPQFLEEVHLKYDQMARKNNAYVIGACGWDSVPCDVGVEFLRDNFDGTLNSVETFLTIKSGPRGVRGNLATWRALIYSYAHRKELKRLRKQLFTSLLKNYDADFSFKLKRKPIFWSDLSNAWCCPFPGSDRSVVNRTQIYNYTYKNERPAQVETYYVMGNTLTAIKTIIVRIIFNQMANYKWTRKLLEDYPDQFSGGIFSKTVKPTLEQLLDVTFDLVLVGKGWDQKFEDVRFQPTKEPNKVVSAKVSGYDPAYLATSTIVVQCALVMLTEKLPESYGVLTPGVAFSKTNLIQKLNNKNINFNILKES